jgi:dUTP pyrophosphatase
MSNKGFSTKIKKVSDKAVVPTRGHQTDSGWDLTVIGIDKIKGDTIFFKTGLQVKPPAGHYFEVYPRSSIAPLPFMLANSVGIIDKGYRGNIMAKIRYIPIITNWFWEWLWFWWPNKKTIKKETKLFQICAPNLAPFKINIVDSLDETERGSNGFGSTSEPF